jgi:siroheme synthase
MSNQLHTTNGRVILAGAGPGDADLITVKLQQRLAEADVIIIDPRCIGVNDRQTRLS